MATVSKMPKGRKTKYRVLVLSPNEILCEGLKAVVAKLPEVHLAGVTTQVEDLIELTRLHRPNVILLTLVDGCDKELEAVQMLTSQSPDLVVLVLDNGPSPDRLTRFLLARARGYFSIEANLEKLFASPSFASQELFSVDARLADKFQSQVGPAADEASIPLGLNGKRLTPREEELVQLLVIGKTNQQIADTLSYSLSTVKNLCRRLFTKLGVENRLQAVLLTYGLFPHNGNP